MLKLPARLLLLITAYSPFVGLLLIKNDFKLNLTCSISIALGVVVLSYLLTRLVFRAARRSVPHLEALEIKEDNSVETLTYLMTYMVPLLVDVKDERGGVFLGAQLLIVFLFYISSNLIRHNLLFSVIGYRIYKIRISESERYLITKSQHNPGPAKLNLHRIIKNEIWLEK